MYGYAIISIVLDLIKLSVFAGVAELADAPDLGSGVPDVQVRFLSPAPQILVLTGRDLFYHFTN